VCLYRYVLTEVDDLRRVESVEIELELGEATYLGFGPSTSMNGNRSPLYVYRCDYQEQCILSMCV